MKYRMKPIEVEAVQLRWDKWDAVCALANVGPGPNQSHGAYISEEGTALPAGHSSNIMGLVVAGNHYGSPELAKEGDWIVRTDDGDLFVYTAERFEHDYGPILEPTPAIRTTEQAQAQAAEVAFLHDPELPRL